MHKPQWQSNSFYCHCSCEYFSFVIFCPKIGCQVQKPSNSLPINNIRIGVSANAVQLRKRSKQGCLRRKPRQPFAFTHHKFTTKGHKNTISNHAKERHPPQENGSTQTQQNKYFSHNPFVMNILQTPYPANY